LPVVEEVTVVGPVAAVEREAAIVGVEFREAQFLQEQMAPVGRLLVELADPLRREPAVAGTDLDPADLVARDRSAVTVAQELREMHMAVAVAVVIAVVAVVEAIRTLAAPMVAVVVVDLPITTLLISHPPRQRVKEATPQLDR
jgi:hypothetical protein